MTVRFSLRLSLLLPLFLAACGDLPEPFLGNPGATARRLAVPATPMLAVPPPAHALLTTQGETDFSVLLALSLQREEIPTLPREPTKTDWRLIVTAERKGDMVVPRYAIQDPSGREQGTIDGAAVPAPGWAAAAPWVLRDAAKDATPKVMALMMSIRATRDHANPNSLLNRAARIYVPAVTGAPGDGNTALTNQIRLRLAELGPLIQIAPEGSDFTVQGVVSVTPKPKGQQMVEVTWTVTRPSGVLNGKVAQLNNVPAGSLSLYWGDVAVAVTQEAAPGINTVIERFIGRDAPAGGAAPASGAPPASGPAPGGKAGPASASPVNAIPPAAMTRPVAPAGR